MSFCSCLIDVISSFISLRILCIILSFAGFSFLCFLHFLGFFHGLFVPIVLLGSVFHIRSCFQMAGILASHLHSRVRQWEADWELWVIKVIDFTVGWLERPLTNSIWRSFLVAHFGPHPLAWVVQAWLQAWFWRQLGKGGWGALHTLCRLLLNPLVEPIPLKGVVLPYKLASMQLAHRKIVTIMKNWP